MQATLNHLSNTRKSVEITVPASEVSAAFNEVVARIAPKVKIPGFRPGKAPKAVLLSKYGREITQDVAEHLVKRHFWSQAEEAGLTPISNPALDKLELKDGSDAIFRALFDVAPAVELPDYKKVELTKRKRIIDDAAVEEHLEALRQRATKFMPVEEAAANELVVTCDIKVKPQGQKAVNYTDQVIQIDSTRPFDKELVGLKADDKKSFHVTHDDEGPLKDKSVAYDVVVKDVRRKVVPEPTDEFAKDMGDYADMKALREALRKDLEQAADRDALSRLQTTLLDSLLDAAPFEVPRSMVALQLDDYCQEFAQAVKRQGMDPNKINWEAYRSHRVNEAERAVRSGYLLQAIGNTEDIQVSDEEIDTDIKQFMIDNHIQETFASFKAEMERRGATTEIKGRIRTDKIFDKLLAGATIKEELLDKAAFQALVELEKKREAGVPLNRFDAGGIEGGDFEGQEGGAPAAIAPAHVHGPDCDHDHDHAHEEEKPKKKVAAKKEEPAEEKPKKADKQSKAEDKPKKKK